MMYTPVATTTVKQGGGGMCGGSVCRETFLGKWKAGLMGVFVIIRLGGMGV